MREDDKDRFQLGPSALRAFAAFEPETGTAVYRSDLTATDLSDSWSGEVQVPVAPSWSPVIACRAFGTPRVAYIDNTDTLFPPPNSRVRADDWVLDWQGEPSRACPQLESQKIRKDNLFLVHAGAAFSMNQLDVYQLHP